MSRFFAAFIFKNIFQLVLYPSKAMQGLYTNLEDTRKGLLAFVAQLKAGKGLTLVAECVEGHFAQMAGTELDRIKDVCVVMWGTFVENVLWTFNNVVPLCMVGWAWTGVRSIKLLSFIKSETKSVL